MLAFLVRRLGLGALVLVAVSFFSWLIFVPALSPLWRCFGNPSARLTLALAVALGFVGVYSRYLRSSLLVSLNEPYAWVARGKGLPEGTVIRRHALRNALVPFTTAMTLDFGAIFGATIAVDLIFGLGGLAELIYNGVVNLADPFLIQASIVVTAAIVVVAGIVGDVVCAWLDPRIRLA